MRNPLVLFFLLVTSWGFASKTDSTFQRHQISFSVTNAMSHQFFDGSSGPTLSHYNYSIPQYFYAGVKFLPFYALHLQIDYSIGINKNIRVETGLGYLLEGLYPIGGFQNDDMGGYVFDGPMFISKITIPIHIKFNKPLTKGNFTCTLGPSFSIPFESFLIPKLPSDANNDFYNPLSPSHASLGFDLKLGYEKRIKKKLIINVGPIINFSDLFFFSKALNKMYSFEKYRPYQYYVGLDVAFIIDTKRKGK